MLKLVYQFPVLTARLARTTGLVVALAASTASAQGVVFVDDIERQAMRSQAAQRMQQQVPAPSQQSRFPQATVSGGIQGQRPQQQPEKQGWSLTKSIGGLFGGNREQQQPERTINMPTTGGPMGRQGSVAQAPRPTLFGSMGGEAQQSQQAQPQQQQARSQTMSRSGSAAKYAAAQQQQERGQRQGGIEGAASRPANKPAGLLAFWSGDDEQPQRGQQPTTQPRQGNIAQVAGQQPLAPAPKWNAAPMARPEMPESNDSEAGMVAMVTDREEGRPAPRGQQLPALPSSPAAFASDMPSSPAVFASDLPEVTSPAASTDMPQRPLPRPMSVATTPASQSQMPNRQLPMPMRQADTNPMFQAGAAAMANRGAAMRPTASQPSNDGSQEIINPHAAAMVDRRMDAAPVSQPKPLPKPLAVAAAPAAKPQVAANAPVKFTAPTQPANPVAPPQSEAAEPSPRAVELLTEANRMSSAAQSEAELTDVVQLCRHVLAIDNSKVAIDYSNNLASWALNRRGEIRTDDGRVEEALLDFNDALRLDPNRYRAIHNRGVLAAQAGRFADAFDDFNRTIELSPDFAKAYSNRAALWVQAGEMEKASSDYRQAIALDPDLAVAHKGRGRVCHMLGQFDLALQHLDAAARLSEGDARIICSRGDLLLDMGRYRNALADYQQAIQIDGSLAVAHRSMAWLLATCPDRDIRSGEAALASANRAMALCSEPCDLEYDTLAAAQAASGDFTSAQASMDKCLELAKEKDQANYQWRKELYSKGQAYITEPASDIQQASYAE
ncbi:tetratricopeptide repeat protein [Aeoliella sp. SH292]|uniref:tetratricopeptide repeat protein n=1 Tax=Aeoliella sp. SH292 TaxID=3454464 RepID=UPI003F983D7A